MTIAALIQIGLKPQSHDFVITLPILSPIESSVSASAKPMPVYLTSVCFMKKAEKTEETTTSEMDIDYITQLLEQRLIEFLPE